MFKNQLQELAQRSCFNLPSYACIREGPDHAPRFKASVNFNGEIFESPSYCPTLRQAEHAAAEVALNVLSSRGPSRSLTARVLDETGIYKNLLQETAHRAGLNLPVYTTVRSGPGHVPVFTCTVELAGMNFTGEPAKTKKQAEKNAAISAWSALKRMPNLDSLTNQNADTREEQDQTVVARVLSSFKPKDENKQTKRKDYNQAKRRIVKGHRDNGSTSSSTCSSIIDLHQKWRLMDLLMDSFSDASTQKLNSFVSLLPPPPPRTTSKILPPTSPKESPGTSKYSQNGPILAQVKGKSRMGLSETAPPPHLKDHLRDEEEWLNVKPDSSRKFTEKECSNSSNSASDTHTVFGASSSMHRAVPLSATRNLNTCMFDNSNKTEARYNSCRHFGPSNTAQIMPASIKTPMYIGAFSPHRIAPAVHIRSVIPVCAAPPSPIRPQQTTKEASLPNIISASPNSLSTQTGEKQVSSSGSSMFKKPRELSSELMKLRISTEQK